ncbi:MAG: methyl-accepting chemotaxis protein [Vibrio sp.]
MKIKTKLIIAFTIAVIVPTGILASLSINEASKVAKEQFKKATYKEIIQVDRAFTMFFENAKRNITYLAQLPIVKNEIPDAPNFTTQQGINAFSDWKSLPGKSGEVWSLFKRFADSHQNLAYVYSGREDGGYIDWPGSTLTKPYDPRVRPWYKSAMAGDGKPVVTNAYYWAGDDATYIAVTQALKNDQGKSVGVVSFDVSVNELTDIVKNITIGEKGFIVLIEDNDNILVDSLHPDNTFKSINKVNTPFFNILTQHPKGLFEVERNNIAYFGQVITSKALGWHFVAMVPQSEVYAAAKRQSYITAAITIPLVFIFILMAIFVARAITSQINNVTQVLQQISQGQGDLTVKLDASSKDEVGELSTAFNRFVDKLATLIREVSGLSTQLKVMAESTTTKAHQWQDNSRQQLEKVTLVTDAISEMSKATAEIASNSEQAASVAEEGSTACNDGKAVVENTRESIETLAVEVRNTNDIIGKLNDNSQHITAIITTIQGIAEQTNLLALNAAIEAARAGEHGRGFAVVADEVRNLSQKTTSSTEEIQHMILELQTTTQQAANVMQNSKSMTDSAVEQANVASESLTMLSHAIDKIKGTSIQIATATEEQSCVCEDVTTNTIQINDIANQLTHEAQGQLDSAEEFRQLSDRMYELVGKFKV